LHKVKTTRRPRKTSKKRPQKVRVRTKKGEETKKNERFGKGGCAITREGNGCDGEKEKKKVNLRAIRGDTKENEEKKRPAVLRDNRSSPGSGMRVDKKKKSESQTPGGWVVQRAEKKRQKPGGGGSKTDKKRTCKNGRQAGSDRAEWEESCPHTQR